MLESDAWPLIGRAREVQVVASVVTGSGGCAGAAITGSLGVGKSRLARDAIAMSGCAKVHWTAGSPAAREIPLGAFFNWLPADLGSPVNAAGEVITALLAGDGPGRTVVVVDDAHLLDDMSAFVLHRLIECRLARVVLTVQTGAPAFDAVSTLWCDGSLQRLDLQPLGHADCRELIESVLDGPMDPISERRLWHLTRGNARFLSHILKHEFDAGRIDSGDGTWRWKQGLTITSALCELIEHHMGDLPKPVAEVVDLLAVAEPLTSQMLIDMVGVGPVEEAEKRLLIVVDDRESEIRLAHPLYGEVRRARAGNIRLRRLRATAAARLVEDETDDDHHSVRVQALILDSGILPAAEDMLRSAQTALWRGDSELSLRFARAANSAGAGWRAAMASAEALAAAGELTAAQSTLPWVGDDAPERVAVELALARARFLHLQGRSNESLAALRRSTSQLEMSGTSAAAVAAMMAFLAASGGDLTTAVRAADSALGCPGLADPPAMTATIAKIIALGETGHCGDLGLTTAGAARLGRSASTSLLRFALAEAQSSAAQVLGFTEASAAAVDAVRDEDQPSDVYRWVSMMAGAANISSGRIDIGVRQIRDVLPAAHPQFLGGWWSRYLVDLAIAHAIRGESGAAERCLARIESTPHPCFAHLDVMTTLAQAWISASTGAVSNAIVEARKAADTAADNGQLAREVLCLQAATRFGDTTTVARLAELALVVNGPRAGAAAAHAVALAADNGGDLMAAAGRYEAMGDLLSAVDAAAQASVAYTRVNRHGSALGATTRYRVLAEQCGVVRTPAVVGATAPLTFTGREREIISLAGIGLTNREIAQRLQLSIRTVEGHLYRAASRVGARDRRELASTICDALAATA